MLDQSFITYMYMYLFVFIYLFTNIIVLLPHGMQETTGFPPQSNFFKPAISNLNTHCRLALLQTRISIPPNSHIVMVWCLIKRRSIPN